ncbi:MAG: sensor histidine kinase [Sarcina sp.]
MDKYREFLKKFKVVRYLNKKRKTVFVKISLIITLAFLIILGLYTIAQVISINVLADKQDKIILDKAYNDMKMDTRVIGHFTNDEEFYNYVYNLAQNNEGRNYRISYDGQIKYETPFKHWDRVPLDFKGEQYIQKYRIKGSNYMVLSSYINIVGENLEVQIMQKDRGIEDVLSGYFPIFIFVAIAGLILSILAGIIISKNILMRIRNLSKTMNQVKNSRNLKSRIAISEASDEFDELNENFNSMMDRVENVFNKQNQFISDASHELRTPLTAIKGHLSLIKRWGKKDQKMVDESLDICLEEIDRLTNMVNSLLMLSREDNKMLNLDDVLAIYPDNIIQDLASHYNVLNSKLKFDILVDENFIIKMRKDDFKQLLIIFIDNAIKYNDKEVPKIEMKFKRKEGKSYIKISDNGVGISKEDLPRILDRFYRADKARTGSAKSFGIGLSIAKSIIKNYNGKINIESEVNIGTKIEIII